MQIGYTIDIETASFHPGNMAPELIGLGIQNPFPAGSIAEVINDDQDRAVLPHDGITIHGKGSSEKILQAMFEDMLHQGAKLYGHNIAYDNCVIMSNYPGLTPYVFEVHERGLVEDTMLREMLIQIAQGRFHNKSIRYSLEAVAKRRTGSILTKDSTRTSYELVKHLAPKDWPKRYKEYLFEDVLATTLSGRQQELKIDKLGETLFKGSPAQTRAYLALNLASVWGIVTDGKAVENLEALLLEEAKGLLQKIYPDIFVNGKRKMDRVRFYIQEAYRKLLTSEIGRYVTDTELKSALPSTPKGALKTDDRTLRESEDPALIALADYQKTQKLVTTYIPMLKQGTTTPLHPRYGMAATGRTTSSKPNIQNQPSKPGVRECFHPRDGYVYCSVDYDSLEMRTLAQVCIWLLGYSSLAEALNNGLDPHLDFAASMLGISYSEAQRRYEAKDPVVVQARKHSKVANFGYPGGMGPKAFVEYAAGFGIHMTLDESTRLKKSWLGKWVEMPEYFNLMSSYAGDGHGILKMFMSERIYGGVGFTDGCNAFFQGLAADGAKHAMWRVSKACYAEPWSPLFGCRPVAFIHDEILSELLANKAHEAAHEKTRLMVQAMQEYVPDVKIEASPVLMYNWSKSAEQVWKNGQLMPWVG